MPLTTALYTGLSGLTVNQIALDVIGNNIANVNTTAFKSSRAMFDPQFSETTSFGTPPGAEYGGANPYQKGLGAVVSGIQRNFAGGNIKPTGITRDLAVQGDGMFIVDDRTTSYTRNGAFEQNSDKYLVTSKGQYLMGYGIDNNFNIIPGALERLRVPTGMMTIAQTTSKVQLAGTLLTSGDLATAGTVLQSEAITNTSGGAVDASTCLVDLLRGGSQVFFDATTLTFSGLRGGVQQGQRTLDVTATTTVGDLQNFMVDAFGINSDAAIPNPGGSAVTDLGGGEYALQLTGNVGTGNALSIGTGGLRSSGGGGSGLLTFSPMQDATGESVHTTMTVYDSLGDPVDMNITVAYESRDNSGTTWRFFANSADDTDPSTVLGSGTVKFDTSGMYVSSTNTTLRIDRNNTGALTPLAITLDLSNVQAVKNGSGSTLQLSLQDGWEAGTLQDFSVGADGKVMGSFSNGMTRTLGQVALATFANYAGLIDTGNGTFRSGPNSGEAVVSAPMEASAGSIVGGALETSNVDISNEFISLITASTGFSAASRMITTSNQLLTELLSIMR
jgi:flagellar hook protein FlgE